MTRPTITDEDTPRIAARIRLAGELLEAHGPLALELTRDWTRGIRSPNLDPNGRGGWRYDPEGEPIPADTTGEAAIHPDIDHHAELEALLRRLDADASRLRDIITAVVPPDAAGTEPTDWCTNHLAIGICEPRHRGDLCRWCYDFKTTHRQLPPPSILGLRHRTGRVTEKQIVDALTNERRRNDTRTKVHDGIHRGRRRAS